MFKCTQLLWTDRKTSLVVHLSISLDSYSNYIGRLLLRRDIVGNFPFSYYFYYYAYYVLTVSALTMLFLFLVEIERMFGVINNYIWELVILSYEEMRRKVIEVEKIHRLFRNTNKTVDKIFG